MIGGRTGLKCAQGSPQSLSAAKPARLSLLSLPPVHQPSGRPEETAGGISSERRAVLTACHGEPAASCITSGLEKQLVWNGSTGCAGSSVQTNVPTRCVQTIMLEGEAYG